MCLQVFEFYNNADLDNQKEFEAMIEKYGFPCKERLKKIAKKVIDDLGDDATEQEISNSIAKIVVNGGCWSKKSS